MIASSKPFTVAILTERLGTNAGGTEVYEKCLLEALAKRVENRPEYRIVPLVSHKNAYNLIPDSLKKRCVILRPEGKAGVIAGTYFALKRIRADLLHACFVTPPVPLRMPVVSTIHDLGFIQFPEHYERMMTLKLKLALKRNISRSDHVIAVSGHTKKALLAYTAIDPGQVSVVYNGFGQTHSGTSDEGQTLDILCGYGIKRPYLLYAGRLEPRKNVKALIEAYDILRKSGRFDGQLVMSGAFKTFLCGEAQKRIEASPNRKDIIQTGHIPDEAMAIIFREAGIFLFVSLYEGFGFPVLEAMEKGVPVVCSNTTSLPEIVGNAGLLVNPEKPDEIAAGVLRIVDNPELGKEMRRLGKNRAACFKWEKTADQMLDVYKKITIRKKSASRRGQA